MRATKVLVAALLVTLALAVVVSPFASTAPDGLEKVATDKAFADRSETRGFQQDALVPGYAFPGVEDERLATALAGLSGVAVMAALGMGCARLRRRRTA